MDTRQDAPVATESLGQKVLVPRPNFARRALAVAIVSCTGAYLFLAVGGAIKSANRLTAAELGAIVVAGLVVGALMRPDIVDRLQKVDIAGIKFDLGEVRERQMEVLLQQQEQRRNSG